MLLLKLGDEISQWRIGKLGVSELRILYCKPINTKLNLGHCVGDITQHARIEIDRTSRAVFCFFCDPQNFLKPRAKTTQPIFTPFDL